MNINLINYKFSFFSENISLFFWGIWGKKGNGVSVRLPRKTFQVENIQITLGNEDPIVCFYLPLSFVYSFHLSRSSSGRSNTERYSFFFI